MMTISVIETTRAMVAQQPDPVICVSVASNGTEAERTSISLSFWESGPGPRNEIHA